MKLNHFHISTTKCVYGYVEQHYDTLIQDSLPAHADDISADGSVRSSPIMESVVVP